MKPTVIFDAGGVLVTMAFSKTLREWAALADVDVETIKKRYAATDLEIEINKGAISTQVFCDRVRDAVLKKRVSNEAVLRPLCDAVPSQIEEVVALKRRLHEIGYRIGIISNVCEAIHHDLQKRFPEVFEVYSPHNHMVLSYRMGAIKPEEAMYAPFGKGEHNIFIDDKSGYLKMPIERLGWRCIQFTPYIDLDEPIRHTSAYRDEVIDSEKYQVANDYTGLLRALREWDVTTS